MKSNRDLLSLKIQVMTRSKIFHQLMKKWSYTSCVTLIWKQAGR